MRRPRATTVVSGLPIWTREGSDQRILASRAYEREANHAGTCRVGAERPGFPTSHHSLPLKAVMTVYMGENERNDVSTGADHDRNRHQHEYQPAQLSLIHISEPTRLGMISYAVFC